MNPQNKDKQPGSADYHQVHDVTDNESLKARINQYDGLSAWFQATCRRYGERPAFSCLGASLTYRQLDALSTQFAAYLQGETVLQAGDRIAVHLPNVLQFPVAVFGALKAGLVVVNTNPLYSADELKQQFIDADVKAVVTLANSAYLVEQALPATRIAQVIVTQLADLHPRPRAHWINLQARYLRKIVPHFKIPGAVKFLRCLKRGRERTWQPPEVQPDDLALLQYTGGVTGPSKGVMLSHGNLLANIYQLKSVLDKVCLSGKEIVIAPLPLYHIYSFTLNCLMMLENGAQMVLIINPRDTAGFVKELERWPFTVFSGLSSLFVALCQNQEFTQLDFSRLKVTISGGTALTQATEQLWQQVTGCAIQEGYGLTEGAPVVAVHPPDVQRRPDSAGPAVRLTEAKVIDAEGESLHPGEIGELCVRGPQVMTGYWQRPQETARALVDGWLVTGDMARISEEGYIEVIDRKQEVIYTSGFAVYPGELENIIACHPDVLECVVVGVPDADLGEVVKLFVVSNNRRLTVKTMRDYCRERLTSYKVPRQVEFRHHLPKTHVGKVLRRKLREEEVNKQCKKRRRL